jgi:ParB-like chromosome segregation protein Spo0J
VTPNSKTPLEPSARSPLSVAYLPLDRVRPDPGNARRHSEKQIRQIARSIETFGFNVPILVDGGGNVVAGHGRLAAARRLGRSEIPTIRLEHLTEAQKRAFMIADNRLAEVAEWDDRRLGEELEALAGVELDFDLEAIGFETDEIDLRIESLNAAERCNDEPPILAPGPSVSRAGDLWRLGPHKLLCGDAECADCDVIVRRWQAHTGALARHEASGVLFEEMAQRRR